MTDSTLTSMSTENTFIIYTIFTLSKRWYIVTLRCCVFCNMPMYQHPNVQSAFTCIRIQMVHYKKKLANLICWYVGMSQKNAPKTYDKIV